VSSSDGLPDAPQAGGPQKTGIVNADPSQMARQGSVTPFRRSAQAPWAQPDCPGEIAATHRTGQRLPRQPEYSAWLTIDDYFSQPKEKFATSPAASPKGVRFRQV